MLAQLSPAFVLITVFTVLLGAAFPVGLTALAGWVAPAEAGGSLVLRHGAPVGSALIGQNFTSAKYFWPRPSALMGTDPKDASTKVPAPFDAAQSGASNLGPTSKALIDRVAGDLKAQGPGAVPADAVTTSGSGLDPHISPENAYRQAARVAAARGVPVARVRALVAARTEGRWLGVLGEPRVNVLLLNLALDGDR